MDDQPPYRLVTRLFRAICDDKFYEELQGDLEESYGSNVSEVGKRKARWRYLRELISLVRPSVIRKIKGINPKFFTTMLGNYVRVTFRNMAKEKLFSAINVAGLAIGITSCLVLLQYVTSETSYDTFHEERENMYRLVVDQTNPKTGAFENRSAYVFYAVHQAIVQEVPEIKSSAQLYSTNGIFEVNKELFREERIFHATASFFDVFSIPLLKGVKADLDHVNTIFLSESLASKYFGSDDPIGKKLVFNAGLRTPYELEVRGIFEDVPRHSHLKPNALISMISLEGQVDNNQFFGPTLRLQDVRWRWLQFYTYIKTHPGVDRDLLASKLRVLSNRYRKPFDEQQGRISTVILQPIESVHLTSHRQGELETPGSETLTRFLLAVAILIVVIAWINYVNLATAKAVNRSKEVGIRKVVGATQSQLRNQFLLESIIINAIAIVLALGIYLAAAPYIEMLTGLNIWMDRAFLFQHLPMFLSCLLGGAFLAGLYPAWVLSAYKPIAVLKGKFSKSKSGVLLRKGLVVFQFVIAVFLLTGIYAVYSQLGYMINHDAGFSIGNTLVIQRPPLPFNEPASRQKVEAFRDNLRQLTNVEDITISFYIPGPELIFRQTCFISGNRDKSLLLSRFGVDANYFNFFDIELAEGKAFTDEMRGGGARVVVNEKLVSDFGFASNADILGKSVEFPGGQTGEIVGVIKDFYHRGLRFQLEPMAINLDSASNGQFIAVKLKNQDLGAIRDLYNASFPNTLFEYTYLQDTFSQIYSEDRRFRRIVTLFTAVAVVIACLGLLGLSSYMLGQRLKEISVRKVLGAKTSELMRLLVKEYVTLITASAIISLPLAFQAIDTWLNSYSSRIQLNFWMFVIPVLILFVLVIGTVGYQTLKATLVNPAEILKDG